MIDVEESALRAFEEDRLPPFHFVGQLLRGVADVFGQLLPQASSLGVHRLQLHLLAAQRRDLRVRLADPFLETLAEHLRLEEIAHADPAASHLVLVAGSDAAPGGPDLLAAALLLAAQVDPLVVREDDVGVLAHHQLLRLDQEAAALEDVDLLGERLGIDDHAVADEAALARMEHPARDQMEDRLGPAHHQGVPRVGAALEAHHHVGPGGEEVDDLPLALVAPLCADDHHVRHADTFSRSRIKGRPGAPRAREEACAASRGPRRSPAHPR